MSHVEKYCLTSEKKTLKNCNSCMKALYDVIVLALNCYFYLYIINSIFLLKSVKCYKKNETKNFFTETVFLK